MNPTNPNDGAVPLGFRPAAARRQPWRPMGEHGLDALLDKMIPAQQPAAHPVPATDARICEILDHLNSSVQRISFDETDWASAVWVEYIEQQPEYLGTEYVYGEPTEIFLLGAVLLWCVDTMAWEHAVGTRVSLAGVR